MKTRLTIALLMASTVILAQDDHHSSMDKRGDHVMGFSHEKTTHHFRLFADGGAIEVTTNDPKDSDTRDQIRMHLSHIAGMFGEGNFRAPMLIHDRVPPGVPVLQRLKAEVSYRFEEIEGGGRVRIATKNKEALTAVHDFLRFQIADHRTGDTGEISNAAGK
ncbi:MAG TPA: hypothetical protein VMR62_33140 [Bryobacteraceae bacterium]|jgi:hypothetical protein|nr:hypothetical protein [Bryobacteraceae bacterium]